jgi:hypothetical protein
MRYRFPLLNLHHMVLAVNITALSPNVAGLRVNGQALPFTQFSSWKRAREHFLELGAEQEAIDRVAQSLAKTSVAVLTILEPNI